MPNFESLYYDTAGDSKKPAVFFLHGFLGNGESWSQITQRLEKEFFCVKIDLPGHGRSLPKHGRLYSFANSAKAIVDIADELKRKKFSLVGYSMGGRVALYMALKYPDRIKRLILESSSPGLKTAQERNQRRKLDESLAQEVLKVPLRYFVEKWYEQPLFNSIKRHKDEFESLKAKRTDNDPGGLAKSLEYMGTGVQKSLWGKVQQLSFPTLLIVGELDHKFQQIAKQMAAKSDKIKVKCVAEAGHNVHFEKPEEYAELLRKFLR
jgi:2-succinyl-6-hydroxy-2,4-cyclohexadiene-1-carboxylate synthase